MALLIKYLTGNNVASCKKLLPLIWYQNKRNFETWYPDAEFVKNYAGAVMYPDETTSKWKVYAKFLYIVHISLTNHAFMSAAAIQC